MTSINKRFESASLENFVCNTETEKNIVAYLSRCIDEGFKQNVIIIGGVGTGKTHLAFAILNATADKFERNGYKFYGEKNVVYRSIKAVIDEIKNSWRDATSISPVNELSNVKTLILDEIGVQYGSNSERTELYDVFNNRYNNMLPVVAISNHSLSELQKILGQRIYDRLIDNAVIFELTGRSKRGVSHEIR